MTKIIKIEGKEYYVLEASYFENESVAEKDGYYWDDEVGSWTKEIADSSTTAF